MTSQSEAFNDPKSVPPTGQRRRLTTSRPVSPPLPPRKCIPRLVFGYPHPNMNTQAIIASIIERKRAVFFEKWNIDPVTGNPVTEAAATTGPEVEAKIIWTTITPREDAPVALAEEEERRDAAAAAVVISLTKESLPVTSGAAGGGEEEMLGIPEKSAVTNQMMTRPGERSPGPGGKRFCAGGISAGGRQRVITGKILIASWSYIFEVK